jgi:hypothetical protein
MATPASRGPIGDGQGRAIERLSAREVNACGGEIAVAGQRFLEATTAEVRREVEKIAAEEERKIFACPSIHGNRDERCAQAARAEAREKKAAAARRILKLRDPEFQDHLAATRRCTQEQESAYEQARRAAVPAGYWATASGLLAGTWQQPARLAELHRDVCRAVSGFAP